MFLDEDQFKRKVEEFKEVGHEYRYRDQMMVQYFSLSMVAMGVLLSVLLRVPAPGTAASFAIQALGCIFLSLLALHLHNINRDRIATLKRKDVLCRKLGFEPTHQNVSGKLPSAPRNIVRFAKAIAVIWIGWSVWSWVGMISCPVKPGASTAPASAAPAPTKP